MFPTSLCLYLKVTSTVEFRLECIMLSCNAGLWFETHLSEENKTNQYVIDSSLCAPYLPSIFAEEHTATVSTAACLSLTSPLTRAPRYVMSGCLEDVRTEACRARIAHISYLGGWDYKTYRAELRGLRLWKFLWGKLWQKWQATAGAKFTKPGVHFFLAYLCTSGNKGKKKPWKQFIGMEMTKKYLCPVGLHLWNIFHGYEVMAIALEILIVLRSFEK